MESHELHDMNKEYRRERGRDSSLWSLPTEVRDDPGDSEANEGIEFDHLLLLEDGSEIAGAWTKWRPSCSGTGRDWLQVSGGSARTRDQDQDQAWLLHQKFHNHDLIPRLIGFYKYIQTAAVTKLGIRCLRNNHITYLLIPKHVCWPHVRQNSISRCFSMHFTSGVK